MSAQWILILGCSALRGASVLCFVIRATLRMQVGMEEETDEVLDHEDSLIIVEIEKDSVSTVPNLGSSLHSSWTV